MAFTPESIFDAAHKAGASDVHLVVGYPILFRIDGTMEPQSKKDVTKTELDAFVKSTLGQAGYNTFKSNREIDASYQIKSGIRLRVNCHYEKGRPSLVARLIPTDIPALEDIGFTEEVAELCDFHDGLILFTGPTGSGKSTAMAAMIKHISETRSVNIITLEDPIEFVFPKSTEGAIRQRQFGDDFIDFPEALKRVLRQDPDIVMVGEMRDLSTIELALTLAETGHLIFGTLHTNNAVEAVDRLVDVFPPNQQQQVRTQLSLSLRAVVAQRLLPKMEGGRVALREILVNTNAVSNIIREARTQELRSVLQTGKGVGMCSMEQDAQRLLKEGLISEEIYDWALKGH